jgi:hypothetical protein
MTKGKPKNLRGLVLYNAQAICDVYKQKTFTSQNLYDEVVKDRPKTKIHALQTTVSKDMLKMGYFEKLGKTTPSILRLTEKGWETDPHKVESYDALIRKQKKGEADKLHEKDKEEPGMDITLVTTPVEDKTQEERLGFAKDVADLIRDLTRQIDLWEVKYVDLENRIKSGIAEDKAAFKEKDKTIANLNQKIVILSNRVLRSGGETALKEAMDAAKLKLQQQTG